MYNNTVAFAADSKVAIPANRMMRWVYLMAFADFIDLVSVDFAISSVALDAVDF